MPWSIDPTDNTSHFQLPSSLFLRLREGVGTFILELLHRGDSRPIETWVIATPSVYEARKEAISIIISHSQEMIRYVTCQLPVVELSTWPCHDVSPIVGCPPSPCRPRAYCNEGCRCKECKPTQPYAMR